VASEPSHDALDRLAASAYGTLGKLHGALNDVGTSWLWRHPEPTEEVLDCESDRIEDSYWLYVVEYALDPDQRRIWPVPDPARRVSDFMFDDGWKDAADFESTG
jgi:hypothetical protein